MTVARPGRVASRRSEATDRALRAVVDLWLAGDRWPVRARAIASAAGASVGPTHRHLLLLERLELVERGPGAQGWRPTAAGLVEAGVVS